MVLNSLSQFSTVPSTCVSGSAPTPRKGAVQGYVSLFFVSVVLCLCPCLRPPPVTSRPQAGLCAPGARLIAESSQFILDLKPEQQVAFEGEVTTKARAMGAT